MTSPNYTEAEIENMPDLELVGQIVMLGKLMSAESPAPDMLTLGNMQRMRSALQAESRLRADRRANELIARRAAKAALS